MNIKAVPVIPSFAVGSANETRDEERRREKQNFDASKNKKKTGSSAASSPATKPNEIALENSPASQDLELTRQVVDSEKLIEMLGHRAPPSSGTRSAFSKKETPNANANLNKKVNRSL